MRTTSSTTYKMTYPNATHFAFVPAIIRLTDISAYKQVTVKVESTTNERTYTETREVHNGSVYFDIQRALQMCFDEVERGIIDYGVAFNDSPLKHTVKVTTTLTGESGSIYPTAYYIDALWGAIRVGESSGGELSRRWFVNYPFSVDVFTKYGDEFDITVDNDPSKGVIYYNQEPNADGATKFRRALLNPAHIFDVAPTNRKIHVALPHGIVLKDDTESNGLTAYTLDIDRTEQSDNNVYLRWVDSQGRYEYYLFKKMGDDYEYTAGAWERNEITRPTAYAQGQNVASGMRQAFTQSIGMTLGAKLVDAPTLDYLITLLGSPIVDMFAGYDDNDTPLWRRVNIAPSKFQRTTKPLQDFSVQIVVPSLNLQTL